MIDTKQSDNAVALKERDRNLTMLDLFGGDEQKTAIAYYVSDMIAKGYNNQKIILSVKEKYAVEWSMRKLSIVKELVHKMWRAEMTHTIEDQVAKEIAVIDVQINEAWEGYEKSKHPKRKKNREEHSTGELMAGTQYDLTEKEENEEDLAGDPKYLQIITDLGKERRKLLGLYAPEKRESGSGGVNIHLNMVGGGNVGGDLMNAIMSMSQMQFSPKVEEAKAEVVTVTPENDVMSTDDLLKQFME